MGRRAPAVSHRVSFNRRSFVGGMAYGEVSSFAASTWIPTCTLRPTSWRRSRRSSVAAFRMGGSEGSAGGGPCASSFLFGGRVPNVKQSGIVASRVEKV